MPIPQSGFRRKRHNNYNRTQEISLGNSFLESKIQQTHGTSVMERFRLPHLSFTPLAYPYLYVVTDFFPRLSVSANRKVYAFFVAYYFLVSFQCKNY